MWGVEGAASFSFRGKFPGHFLPLSQAKNSANKSLLHTVKRKPPAVHLYSQAPPPLCDQRSREEAVNNGRTTGSGERQQDRKGIRSMEPLDLERLIERFVRSGHPGGLQKSMRVPAPDRSSPILCAEFPFVGQNMLFSYLRDYISL